MIQSHIPSLFSKPSRYFLNHSINPFNTALAFWLESSLYLHFFQCIQSIGNHVNYYSIPIQS